jgi:hypothetical protein
MMRTRMIAVAFAVFFAGIETATAFTAPSTSIVSRAVVGNNVRLIPKSPYQSRSPLYMTAEVATEGGESGEKLFEGFGKGIVRDFKARIPFLKSDVKDGLNVQVSLV